MDSSLPENVLATKECAGPSVFSGNDILATGI